MNVLAKTANFPLRFRGIRFKLAIHCRVVGKGSSLSSLCLLLHFISLYRNISKYANIMRFWSKYARMHFIVSLHISQALVITLVLISWGTLLYFFFLGFISNVAFVTLKFIYANHCTST